ncbi:MAG: hypothetical protein ACJ8J0_07530 [Longimicrobiaceae bacterium]
MMNDRITWVHGEARSGPRELIGVLELRADDSCRAVFAERVEVDGKCHILLAKQAWGYKDSLDTRWWSLVLDADHKAYAVRTGSCGDPLTRADVSRVSRALRELGLLTEHTMLYLADGPAVMPGRA